MTTAEMNVEFSTTGGALDDDLIDYDDEDLLDQAGAIDAPDAPEVPDARDTEHVSSPKGTDDQSIRERTPTVTADVEDNVQIPTTSETAVEPNTTSNDAPDATGLENSDSHPVYQEDADAEDERHAEVAVEFFEDVTEQSGEPATEARSENDGTLDGSNYEHDEIVNGADYGEQHDNEARPQDETAVEAEEHQEVEEEESAYEQGTPLGHVEELQDPDDIVPYGTHESHSVEDTNHVDEPNHQNIEEGKQNDGEHPDTTWSGGYEDEVKRPDIDSDTGNDVGLSANMPADTGDDGKEDMSHNIEATERPSQGEGNVSENRCHTVTVQYKGEEFPLFSHDAEGFFSEESCLGLSIELLLAGLRVELENELADEEELVFQIDELGLEYAESSKSELCSVTLSYILDIFHLLVKNQGHEGPRTLYTYLFTKTSATKRFASLCESATAGRGLDEVCQLFESPMPQGVRNEDNESIELYQQLDDFESAGEGADTFDEEIQMDMDSEQAGLRQENANGDGDADPFLDDTQAELDSELMNAEANNHVEVQGGEHFLRENGEEHDEASKAEEGRDADANEESLVEALHQPDFFDTELNDAGEAEQEAALGMNHVDDVEPSTQDGNERHAVGLASNATLDDVAGPSQMLEDEEATLEATTDVEINPNGTTIQGETEIHAMWDHDATHNDAAQEASPTAKRRRDVDEEQDVGDEKDTKRQRS